MSTFRLGLGLLALAGALVHCSSGDVTFPGTTSSTSGAGGSVSTFSGGTGGATGSGGATASGTTASGTTASGSSSASGGGCKPVACDGTHIYACADCMDNDGDGKVDAEDPDCLGPCSNNEKGFDLLIPGAGNAPCKRDCYFDKDSGAGNDDCAHDLRCDPLSPDAINCKYTNPPPPNADCPATQSDTCTKICKPLTPNGCDCFGCCEVPGGAGKYVYLGSKDANDVSTCTLADAGDPAKCHPCTPFGNCLNTCEKCELCLGKTTLPPECQPSDQCPAGIQACGLPGQNPCPAGEYCITGCCQVPSPT